MCEREKKKEKNAASNTETGACFMTICDVADGNSGFNNKIAASFDSHYYFPKNMKYMCVYESIYRIEPEKRVNQSVRDELANSTEHSKS